LILPDEINDWNECRMYNENEEESAFSVNILLALLRYKWRIGIAICALLVLTVAIVLIIPPVFRSTGIVMVETQQIPANLVQSTITNAASEQIDIITQRVMTREKLASIIRKHPYFEYENADPVAQNDILINFRDSVTIGVTSANSGRQSVAIGFSVSFDSPRPLISQKVATDLVKLFLNENIKARTQRASETTEFLRSEADKIRTKLERTEAQVAEFKKVNKDSLPEHLNLYIGMREDVRRNLSEIKESVTVINDQIMSLQNQLSLSRQQGNGEGVDKQTELENLKKEYANLTLQYQPDHPDLVLLRNKIEQLESGTASDSCAADGSEYQRNLANQISTLEAKRRYLNSEKEVADSKLEDLEARIIKIPQVEREFTSINRNYQAIQEQYQSLQEKAQSAAMAESLEQEQKAERFTLLEPPPIPIQSYKPDRKKLLVMAIVVSFCFPIGIVIVLGFLDKSVRTGDALTRVVGAPPLIEIPMVYTQHEISARKKFAKYLFIALAVSTSSILLFTHLMIIPLDDLLHKIMMRASA